MASLTDVLDWVGLSDDPAGANIRRLVRSTFLRAMGAPMLVRQLVAIPKTAYDTAVEAWRITYTAADGTTEEVAQTEPSPVEIGHAGVIRRVARLLLKLPDEVDQSGAGVAAAAAAAAAAATAAAAGTTASAVLPPRRTVLTSKVMDQGDDSEVKALLPGDLRTLISEWMVLENDGEEPLEEEEATGDQIAALDARIKNGAPPFADFGIFRPFGLRLGRALKFVVHHMAADGKAQSKEINGPSSFEEWSKCWAVFVFAMTVLKQASRTRLARYHSKIKALAETYPTFWWIIGSADIEMRSEHLVRVHRNCLSLHADGKLADFVEAKPWDLVFREAAADGKFWNTKVGKQVMLFATRIIDAKSITDPGYGRVQEIDAFGSSAAGSGSRKKKREQGSSSSAPPRKSRRRRSRTQQRRGD